jgi:hypothetical protein
VRALVECHIRTMTAELEAAASTAPPTGPAPDTTHEPSSGSTLPVAPVETGGDEIERPVEPPRTQPPPPPWYDDPLGWAGAGTGAALGVVSVVLFLDASSLEADASREDREDVRNALRDRAASRRTWGTVTGIAGGALFAAGVVKLVLTPDAGAPDERRVILHVTPTSVGISGVFW